MLQETFIMTCLSVREFKRIKDKGKKKNRDFYYNTVSNKRGIFIMTANSELEKGRIMTLQVTIRRLLL